MFLRGKVSEECSVQAAMLFHVVMKNNSGLIQSIVKDKTHVQTACEPHDLNMDFWSFDNGFKQLYT